MNWKKRSIKDCRLYAILDKDVLVKKSLLNTARKMMDAGVDVIQYRDKSSDKKTILEHSLALKKILQKSKTLFIINDHADVAYLAGSDGVHLGQRDLPIESARRLLGPSKIIGVSCRNLRQAITAQKEGADYLGLGPIFPTPVKKGCSPVGLKVISEFRKKIRIPFFVIGGINSFNLSQVSSAGAKRAAICRGLCRARDIAKQTVKIRGILIN